jgi:small subunit ribosomal protein S9
MEYIYSTGKRKTSIARIFLKIGDGNISINGSENNYIINNKKYYAVIKQPLFFLKIEDKIDLKITVKGGGITGQIEAIRHGISKALSLFNKNDDDISFRKKLKKLGFLTRDSRIVERKKVGRRKARKKEQYSKR